MKQPTNDLEAIESIAVAIRAEMPEEYDAGSIACDIYVVAAQREIPFGAIMAYIHDRPRPTTFSAPGLLRFCERYNLSAAAQLAGITTKEPSQ